MLFCPLKNVKMCRFLIELLVLFLFLSEMTSYSESHLTKRAPLEFGLATFPAAENLKRAILASRTKTEMNLEVRLNLPRSLSHHTVHDREFHHEWIPGKIRHHLFIPPHYHNYFAPIIVTKPLVVKSPYEIYPRAYGGFGLGAFAGGQGAGHGYHVVPNE